MAFALSIKSKQDFPLVGSIFLLLTLILSSFTLIYSAIFLEQTIIKCNINITSSEGENRNTSPPSSNNCFIRLKSFVHDLNQNYFLKMVNRNDPSSESSTTSPRRIELNSLQKDNNLDSIDVRTRGGHHQMENSISDIQVNIKELVDNEN
jgi:hypothetical protein